MTLRTAAITALVVTVVLGMISNLLFLWAFEFRVDWFLDPAQLVAAGPESPTLLRWAALTDLFSYYLPTAIVALALWHVLRPRSLVLADGATLGALGYVLAGSMGAIALATAGPILLQAYAAPGADQASIATAFAVLVGVVWRGIWQLLDTALIGAWLVGVGLLTRADQPAFARLSLALGGFAWLVTAFNLLGLGVARDAALGVVFVLWAVWSIWLILLLGRRRAPFATLA
jgi:hypothetical protein